VADIDRMTTPLCEGERCIHHVNKDSSAIPDEAYRRIGKPRPESGRP
jgi:hypothetical protein